MVFGSCLSDKALCRFRTKPCERLLATGTCSFKDKCQYSHDDWLRRNPLKVAYEPTLCPKLQNCQAGRRCGFAHSDEEILYHPRRYKVDRCYPRNCRGFYCPNAHYPHELRDSRDVVVTPPSAENEDEAEEVPSDLLPFDEILRLDAAEWRTKGGATSQLQGSVKVRNEWRRCSVRLVSYTREERAEVDRLMREFRVWIRVTEGALAVRRSVASVALALPEAKALPGVPAGSYRPGHGQAITLLRQVSAELAKMHDAGVAHVSLNPSSVTMDPDSSQTFRLADFLPKLRTLMALKRGWQEKDGDFQNWALWQPPEVQDAGRNTRTTEGSDEDYKALEVDLFAVDAWQLGAVAAAALLGGHPYGDGPAEICKNIACNAPVRLDAADYADPELSSLLRRLLDPNPEQRPRIHALACEPALREAVSSESSSCDSDTAFSAGAVVTCSWEGGVRLRQRRIRAFSGTRHLKKGDSSRVCERRGGWIRLEGGWAPLRGVGDAAGSRLFEVADSSPSSVATTADTCTAELVSYAMLPPTPCEYESVPVAAGPPCWPPQSDKWTAVEWTAFWAGYRDASRDVSCDALRVELKLPAPPTPDIPKLPAKVDWLYSCELLAAESRYWIQQEGFVWL